MKKVGSVAGLGTVYVSTPVTAAQVRKARAVLEKVREVVDAMGPEYQTKYAFKSNLPGLMRQTVKTNRYGTTVDSICLQCLRVGLARQYPAYPAATDYIYSPKDKAMALGIVDHALARLAEGGLKA